MAEELFWQTISGQPTDDDTDVQPAFENDTGEDIFIRLVDLSLTANETAGSGTESLVRAQVTKEAAFDDVDLTKNWNVTVNVKAGDPAEGSVAHYAGKIISYAKGQLILRHNEELHLHVDMEAAIGSSDVHLVFGYHF